MVAVNVGAAAADGVCSETSTPLSAKSINKTGIQKGMFLIFHCLLSLSNKGFVHFDNRFYLAWLARIMLFADPHNLYEIYVDMGVYNKSSLSCQDFLIPISRQ